MRIPVTPHEIGHDSFVTHSIANSISSSGYAKWWIHPLSILGLYPYSMASALPFYFSGASQSMNLDMEWTILVVLLSFGTFSAFTAYLMAGAIKDVEIFKLITAFVYSTSLGILIFTTWNASARGLFLVLLPLFIYLLIKCRYSKLKYGILAGILFILLMATHNLIFFVIPIIICFGIILIINHLMSNSKNITMAVPITIRNIGSSNIFVGTILLITYIIIIVLAFIIFSDRIGIQTYAAVNSTYVLLKFVIFSYTRSIGILIVFAIVGLIYFLFKQDKTFEEWFLIVLMLFLTLILPVVAYTKFFILPFAALLISTGIIYFITIFRKRKSVLFLMIILFVISSCVATFYQFGRTGVQSQQGEFWASDGTFEAAMWIKANTNKPIYSDNNLLSRRILAYSDASMLSETNLINFIQNNMSYYESLGAVMRSPYSVEFYNIGPYKSEISPDLNYYWYKLRNVEYGGKWGKTIIQMFNLNYYIKDENYYSTIFSRSVYEQNNKLFDNGEVSIWDL